MAMTCTPISGVWRCALAGMLLACAASAAADEQCSGLMKIPLTDAVISAAASMSEPVPHCKATGTIGGKIGFAVWLPQDWNGRFLMGGAGGFVSAEDNQALRFMGDAVLRRGYATASTDTGHQGDALDNSWGLNDWEAIVNYGHLAMHRTVVTSKQLIAAHYGNASSKSLFIGCSNGGRQALQEAQRYPEDFDVIISGAPALNFAGVAAAFLNVTQHMYPDPNALTQPVVSSADRRLLRDAIEAQCDDLDGVTDGILHNPTRCGFDVNSLACTGRQQDDCLGADKIAAIKAVYEGPRDRFGPLHFGFPFGAEHIDNNGWGAWLTGGATPAPGAPSASYAFGMGFMRHFVFHDPDWTYRDFDWNRFRDATTQAAAVLNADNADLSAFRARGGKLLMFHGWSDVALSANMTTDYVERVYAHDATARDDVKLFMLPGVLHCYGGDGPSVVDWLQAAEDWHNSGDAPAELIATYPDKPGARRLCAWPQMAAFSGGNPDTAEAYVCQ